MTSNYKAISDKNQKRYGTDIGRIGRELLADRYADRTHFIFELLQNAEDALGRQTAGSKPREVAFTLKSEKLILAHFGLPFDEADVRSICSILESTKDESSIGKFGIGFKSVYAFTDCPEIHSGNEDFAIKNYVHPMPVPRVERDPDETLIVLPLKDENMKAQEDITNGFRRLGPSALLFLQHIKEINWSVQDGVSGVYLRSEPEQLGDNVHKITVIGQESGQQEVDQNWQVFHRDVLSFEQKKKIGRVELAFSVKETDNSSDSFHLVPITSSPLVVFFPTVVETNLSFLVQGPYRTTPSRDNLDPDDEWNRGLVKETSKLLVDAMRWLRDQSMLDTSVLSCLPLNREKFPDGEMFTPLFEAVRKALIEKPLLPRFGGGYVTASQAMLARTQDLRELLNPEQIRKLFDGEVSAWLTGEITQDRTPEIRQYVMDELDVKEVTPATLITRLTREFLEAQSDDWIVQLYRFLNGQRSVLRDHLDTIPIIRLSDGTHVVVQKNGKPQAFLPSDIETGFPIMRRSVCAPDDVRDFLISLGIEKPNPVDDVILNVLPNYQNGEIDVSDDEYAHDIKRILVAFDTDSKDRQNRLATSLKETTFLKVIDAGDGKRHMDKPENAYLATDRLKKLFAGVSNVMIVDDEYDCLHGEKIRTLLEACGAVRYPRPEVAPSLSYETRRKMRQQAGHENTSGRNDQIENWVLHGFDGLIKALPTLQPEQRKERARLIWESLGDMENRRGKSIFEGHYKWTDYGQYEHFFPAATFVHHLNKAAWVPDASGELQKPCLIAFEDLGWEADPFLQDKIKFKSSARDQLAQEAGIEPELIDFLKEKGITFDELKEKFSKDTQEVEAESEPSDGEGGEESVGGGKRTPGHEGGRPFVSYVGTHPDEKDSNPDGLDQATRMRIEEQAIEKILQEESELERTPKNNPGFDLYKTDESGKTIRWIEVKSMTGSLEGSSVGLSRTQFDLAREKGLAYWLYIVEHASDTKRARVLRIQDPAGRARTFTFDHGWAAIAQFEPILS